MQTESQLSLDHVESVHTENISTKDGEAEIIPHTATAPDPVTPKQPGRSPIVCILSFDDLDFLVEKCSTTLPLTTMLILDAAKKQTRQWAAWTHQEEHSFFTALRQVGKACSLDGCVYIWLLIFFDCPNHVDTMSSLQNFEKITSRVQSKNKDQVRHYYYRLVRRMNKLLGPGVCLDAKNSKDTNSAMLRWWSLLEKYSCKASKLHLKPRRFKIFIEALEHQLLKDRKKRRRPSHAENICPTASTTVHNQTRASGHESRAVKLVLTDSQNVQKVAPGKGSSLKRNVNIGVNRNNCKGESAVKSVRQRRKPVNISSVAYKRWERAAIAGVSLVADAAEHLERIATDKEAEQEIRLEESCIRQDVPASGLNGSDNVEEVLPPKLAPTCLQNFPVENNVQLSMKLKLQLFPIDENTRRALEEDKHNPHLELTLSMRKKISSVLEHLNRKWGNSRIAYGELVLFPYDIQRESLVSYHKWTQDSIVSAADVYEMIGRPRWFRLRYGWFSNTELETVKCQAPMKSYHISGEQMVNMNCGKEQISLSVPTPTLVTDCRVEKPIDAPKDQQTSLTRKTDLPHSLMNVFEKPIEHIGSACQKNIQESSDCEGCSSSHRRGTNTGRTIMTQVEERDDLKLSSCTTLSAGEWADSLTNISVGDLLSEMSPEMEATCVEPPMAGSSCFPSQFPFSCDSFDAAIAAHLSKHQERTGFQSVLASHESSIWEAEDTCDAFLFQKNHVFHKSCRSSGENFRDPCQQTARASLEDPRCFIEELPTAEEPVSEPSQGVTDECRPDMPVLENSSKDLNGLADMYWPDSLGPLDLDAPSCRYHSEDMILSDSLGGLNRLTASSLDAFQNCLFLGLDKKDIGSTVETQVATSFADYKIGNDV
ncbi:hypothetical protein RJ641_024953 [Dillenia turbinata]|uniref:SANT domain-containing protein n=1 Tax=Dillenia turbinata TaxID=194707 RepID=A0AAN8W8I1_9MAGN